MVSQSPRQASTLITQHQESNLTAVTPPEVRA